MLNLRTFILLALSVLVSCNSGKIEKISKQNEGLKQEINDLKADLNYLQDSVNFYKQNLESCAEITDEERVRLNVLDFYYNVLDFNVGPAISKNDDGIFELDVAAFRDRLNQFEFLSKNLIESQLKKCQPCAEALKKAQLTEMGVYEEPTDCSFIQHANFWSKSQESADLVYINTMVVKGMTADVNIRLFQGSKGNYAEVGLLKVTLKKAKGKWQIDSYSFD